MYSDTDKYYNPKDLAEMLGIESVTLRKYSIALEKAGYIFMRNDSDRRLYSERDVMALQQLKALRDRNALNVENAAMAVATKHRQVNGPSETVTHSDKLPVVSVPNRYEALEDKIDAQAVQIAQMSADMALLIEMNRELVMRMDERESSIQQLTEIVTAQKAIAAAGESRQEERLREHDEKLTMVLRGLQETKKLAERPVWKRIFGL